MKYKEFYLLVFPFIFLLLTSALNRFVRTKNYIDTFQDIDSKGYIYNAEIFYKYGHFKKGINPPYFSLGYPAIISFIYKYLGHSNDYVIWLQIILTIITCFFIFYTTSIIFNSNVGIIAFIFSCINVGFITFANFILTETLLTFFLSLFLYLFVLFLYKKRLIYVLFSGLILGLSIFVKPVAIYFIFSMILLLVFFQKAMRFKSIILFSLAFYLPVISYMYYNKITFGYSSVTALGNENLYFYLFPKVLALKNKSNITTERKMLQSKFMGNKLNPKNWGKLRKYFIYNLKNNPKLFIMIWLKNVGKTFMGLYTTNLKVLTNNNIKGGELSFFKTKGHFLKRIWIYIISGTNSLTIKLIGVYEALWSLLRYIFVLLAFVFLLIKREFKYLFLFASYIFYFSIITGHDGCARFRMMFEPALIILAAQGFFIIYNRLRLCLNKS